MLETSGHAHLARESLPAERDDQLAAQHLDGDVGTVAPVERPVHGCHPAATDFTRDLITICERLQNGYPGIGHDLEDCRDASLWRGDGNRRGEEGGPSVPR